MAHNHKSTASIYEYEYDSDLIAFRYFSQHYNEYNFKEKLIVSKLGGEKYTYLRKYCKEIKIKKEVGWEKLEKKR